MIFCLFCFYMARVILQSLFEESLIRKSGEEELLVLLTTCIDHPQTPNPCRQSADKHMETDLQVKFIKKKKEEKKSKPPSEKKKKKVFHIWVWWSVGEGALAQIPES